MLDELHSLIKAENSIIHMKNLLHCVAEIVEMSSDYYVSDKNQTLDFICQLIQTQKTRSNTKESP